MFISPALEKKHAVTMIRLSIKPSQVERLQVGTKPRRREWTTTIEFIKRQPGCRYVLLGQELEQPGKALIIVGWDNTTTPPPRFRPASSVDDGPVLPALQPHLTGPPQLLTLWHAYDRATERFLGTRPGPFQSPGLPQRGGVAELMMLRGPVGVVKACLSDIMKSIDALQYVRLEASEGVGMPASKYSFRGGTPFIVEDDVDRQTGPGAPGDEQDGAGTFAFRVNWKSQHQREEFQDPSIPDKYLSAIEREAFGETWWEDRVAACLRRLTEEHGVQMSSWDYQAYILVAENGTGL